MLSGRSPEPGVGPAQPGPQGPWVVALGCAVSAAGVCPGLTSPQTLVPSCPCMRPVLAPSVPCCGPCGSQLCAQCAVGTRGGREGWGGGQMPPPSLSCAAPAAQGVLGTSRGEGKTGPLRHFPRGQGGVGVTNSGVLSSENCRMQRASMHPGLWTPRDHVGELGGWPSGPSGACAMRAEPGPQAIPGAGELSASVEPGERGYW